MPHAPFHVGVICTQPGELLRPWLPQTLFQNNPLSVQMGQQGQPHAHRGRDMDSSVSMARVQCASPVRLGLHTRLEQGFHCPPVWTCHQPLAAGVGSTGVKRRLWQDYVTSQLEGDGQFLAPALWEPGG